VLKIRDQGIWLNGSVENGIVVVLMSRPLFAFLISTFSTRADVNHVNAKWRITVVGGREVGQAPGRQRTTTQT